ncbi:MAG: hypothetical protein ACRDO2_12380 [Nocardioidaceae bacterium]
MGDESKGISSVAGWIFMGLLGAFMVYFGVRLIATSVAFAQADGSVFVALALGAIGVALVVLPLLTGFSQIRAMLRRRG